MVIIGYELVINTVINYFNLKLVIYYNLVFIDVLQ